MNELVINSVVIGMVLAISFGLIGLTVRYSKELLNHFGR